MTVWLLIDPIPLLHKGWNGVGLVRHPPPFHSCGRNGIGGGETNLWLRFPRDVWAMSGHASHLALNLGCGRLSMLLSLRLAKQSHLEILCSIFIHILRSNIWMHSFHTDCKADGHMSDATGTAHASVRLYVAKASLVEQTQHTHFLSRWALVSATTRPRRLQRN